MLVALVLAPVLEAPVLAPVLEAPVVAPVLEAPVLLAPVLEAPMLEDSNTSAFRTCAPRLRQDEPALHFFSC